MVRPRSMLCPLQVVLGTSVHHRTGSALIIEVLHKLGQELRTKYVFSNKQIERRCPSLEELRKKHIPIFYRSKILKHEVNDILRDSKEFNLPPQMNFLQNMIP